MNLYAVAIASENRKTRKKFLAAAWVVAAKQSDAQLKARAAAMKQLPRGARIIGVVVETAPEWLEIKIND